MKKLKSLLKGNLLMNKFMTEAISCLYRFSFTLVIICCFFRLSAQTQNEGQLHGNFQFDLQSYKEDSLINAPEANEKVLSNSYANFIYTKGDFTAGFRYEGYLNTLKGISSKNDGVGVPYRFASYKAHELEITVGTFYEQFGTGLTLRAYEEKALGYDNAIDGVRVKFDPLPGISVKGVIGKQRYYFDKGPGLVRGIDGEISANDLFKKLSDMKTRIILGGSFVSKYESDRNPVYVLPENVGATAGRLNIIRGKFNFYSEYAYKINDPSSENNYIYKEGQAALFNATFSQKGLGIVFNAKRIDNMGFRSERDATGNDLLISYLPLIAKSHAYSLPAMYPYATQSLGETGIQGEVMYKFKKETFIGGKYGTNVNLNFSRIVPINKYAVNDTTAIMEAGTLGYKSDMSDYFNELGKDSLYYQDFNIEITKKWSKKLLMILTYQNLIFNYKAIRVTHTGYVYANSGVADLTYKINDNNAIRFELQALFTRQDMGNWAMGLAEYSIAPHWFFTVMDQYNYGNDDPDRRMHYYTCSIGFIKEANRIQIGYGRQREGVLCVGGICRTVPASNGLIVSITSSF